jgi:MFS family permease
MALVDPNAVIPAFVIDLTGSAVWVGGLAALLAAAAALPQLLVARYVEPLRRKRPVLLTAIYLRAACWASLGLLITAAGPDQPKLILWGLVALLGLFSAGGALGGVPYTDLIGKVIPERRRGAFFGSTQATGKLFSLGGAVLAGVVLSREYPANYATLFLLSALFLSVASLGVWAIREPPREERLRRLPWGPYLRSLREPLRALRGLALVAWATGFSLMAIPFYVVAAKQVFGAPPEATAWFIAALVAGALAGSLVWAQLVDRFGSRRMLLVCVTVAALTPLVALSAWGLGWPILVFVAGLVGATTAGRGVGFSSALLEIAPSPRRPSYAATYALLSLPVAAMPLIGGLVVKWLSFAALFGMTALLLVVAIEVVRRWDAARARHSLTA